MTNGFAFNYSKSLQIYFFCVYTSNKWLSERIIVGSTVVAVAILEVACHLKICNSCFHQMRESWPMGLFFKNIDFYRSNR